VWLGGWPVFLDGLDGTPQIGDRFGIDGEWWRVVEWTDRIVCERSLKTVDPERLRLMRDSKLAAQYAEKALNLAKTESSRRWPAWARTHDDDRSNSSYLGVSQTVIHSRSRWYRIGGLGQSSWG
jgi:hypothetical protein